MERYSAAVALLSQDHRAADGPSFAHIERVSRELAAAQRTVHGVRVKRIPGSTANDVLRGVHTQTLRWELVRNLWAVIRHIAEDQGGDTGAMSSLPDLHRSYHQPAEPAAGAPEPSATEPAPPRPAWPKASPPQRLVQERAARHGSAFACDTGLMFPGPLDPGLGPLAFGAHADGDDPHDAAQRLLDRARRHDSDVWWRDFGAIVPTWFAPYLTLEPELALFRIYAPRRVPGLLQTADYARHVITQDLPGIPADELAQRIQLRQRRQELLRRPDAPRYWAFIDQRVLARRTAPPEVLRGQLRHLITMAAFPHITLQLVRVADAERVVPAGPITLMRFPEPRVGDIVYLEQNDHGIYLCDAESVKHFWLRYNRLAFNALEPHESVSLLLKKLDRLQP